MTLVNLSVTQINNGLRQPGFSLGTSQFTYSIPVPGSTWPGYTAGSEPFTDYSTFDAAAAGHFRAAIALWDALISPDFAEVADNGSTRGEVRVAYTSTFSGGAYAYSGTPTTPGGRVGDIWVDSAYVGDDFSPGNSNGLFGLLLHEIGHTLGLKHPFESSILSAAYENQRFTVMSYSLPGWAVSFTSGAGSTFSSTEPVPVATPMVLDIAAAQAVYGAETTTATGNDVYQFDENEAVVRSIYDGGGIDTLDLANFTRTVDIDLRPGSYSSIGIFSRAEQIAFWTAAVGNAGFVSNTINNVADLFTFTENLGIAFTTVIENATGGSGNDTLLGNDVANILRGGAGNDILNGGLNADSLYGGTGDDQYVVDLQGDLIFESVGEGSDTVTASAGYYLFANVENLVLDAAAGNIFGVGNAAANTITGNAGSNLLIGGGGDDSVSGGSGVDSLFGESGNDTLNGGAGIDYLVGGAGNDTLNGDADPDALYGEDGDDTLVGGSDFQTDILVGGNGNDTLNGASGLGDYDLMDGGAGNDSYQVDTPNDLTFEAAGGGIDTVFANIVGAGYYLYAQTENLLLEGTTPFGVGNELANQLTGNAIGNYLLGGLGDDQLNGKAGSDVLFGEGGADIFQFERGSGGDVIGDFLAGIDKIKLTGLGFASFGQLQAGFIENGGTTAINLGQGDFIVLNGVTNAQLSAVDFLFG